MREGGLRCSWYSSGVLQSELRKHREVKERVWRPECVCGGLRTRPELADRRNPSFQRRWGVG